MVRFITRKLGFVVCISAAFLATCGFSDAQLKNGNTLPRPKPPLQIALPPAPPTPGAFTGYVNGKVAIVEYDNMQPAPGKKGGTFKTVGSIDLKSNLSDLWNLNRTVIQGQIANLLKTPIDGHKLYSPTITVATASASNKLYMAITPNAKMIAVHYYLPGNKIVCQADVAYWFDPTVTINFDLDMTLVLTTNGPTSAPIVLKSATLYAYNAKVTVNSDRNAGAEKTINATKMDVKDKLAPAITLLNINKLAPFTTQGFGIVTPTHTIPNVNTGADLILELTRSQPVAAQARKK